MRNAVRTSLRSIVAIVLASLCGSCSYSQKKMEPQSARGAASPAQSPGKGFAVVELFTSEGCSSCPPADALLPKLKELYGDRLHILSFHVDYWNRLGWKDPFSSANWSARQNRYATVFHSESVYTPQAVVNGTAHITGSNRAGVARLIDAGLEKPNTLTISVNAQKDGVKAISATYDAQLRPGEVLNVAFVQLRVSTDVKRGENGGRKLEHHSVVRDLKTVRSGAGQVSFILPEGLNAGDVAVIAYAQEEATMRITGAEEATVR